MQTSHGSHDAAENPIGPAEDERHSVERRIERAVVAVREAVADGVGQRRRPEYDERQSPRGANCVTIGSSRGSGIGDGRPLEELAAFRRGRDYRRRLHDATCKEIEAVLAGDRIVSNRNGRRGPAVLVGRSNCNRRQRRFIPGTTSSRDSVRRCRAGRRRSACRRSPAAWRLASRPRRRRRS